MPSWLEGLQMSGSAHCRQSHNGGRWRILSTIQKSVREASTYDRRHKLSLMRRRSSLVCWCYCGPQECGKYLTSAYLLSVLPKDLRKMCVLYCRACSQTCIAASTITTAAHPVR